MQRGTNMMDGRSSIFCLRRWALGLLIALAALPARAQDLTVGVRSGQLSLDPQFNSNGPDTSAARNVFDALLRRGPDFTLLPNLATEWHAVGPDLWEFKLRRDVSWQDGTPFTAADVAFSVARVPQAADATGGFRAYVKSIRQIIVVDDHTIRFATNGPAATLPAELEEVFILSQKAVTQAGPEGFKTGAAAIGTGPYRFVAWQPSVSARLQRWDGYWGADKPHWKTATFEVIPEDASRAAALLSGQVDLINYVPPSVVGTLAANPQIGVFKCASIYVYILHPDGRETSPAVSDLDGKPLPKNPFRDLRVRKAMSMAIDRDAIAQVTMEGLATPARQLMPLNFVGVDPNAPKLPYDVKGAQALMAEAGYPKGFKVRLTCTNNRLPNDDKVCIALAPMLRRIGI
ncbi:MAG TPA: ABC transporter substrate-binding protein, partial [Rhodopila sp.]